MRSLYIDWKLRAKIIYSVCIRTFNLFQSGCSTLLRNLGVICLLVQELDEVTVMGDGACMDFRCFFIVEETATNIALVAVQFMNQTGPDLTVTIVFWNTSINFWWDFIAIFKIKDNIIGLGGWFSSLFWLFTLHR